MQLTKKQIKQMENMWLGSSSDYDDLREVFRGYRLYLAEVEHHEHFIRLIKDKHARAKYCKNDHLAAVFSEELDYHLARLSALKKGAE